jgi:hypothetical protein
MTVLLELRFLLHARLTPPTRPARLPSACSHFISNSQIQTVDAPGVTPVVVLTNAINDLFAEARSRAWRRRALRLSAFLIGLWPLFLVHVTNDLFSEVDTRSWLWLSRRVLSGACSRAFPWCL